MRHEWEESGHHYRLEDDVLFYRAAGEAKEHRATSGSPSARSIAREAHRLASALAEERERTLRLVDEAIAARQGYAGDRDVGARMALVKLRQQLTKKEG